MSKYRFIAPVVALMLVLAACTSDGGDGDGGDDATFEEGYSFGGADSVLNTAFGNGGDCMFTEEVGCYLHHQASFITSFFEDNFPDVAVAGETYDFFPMPPAEFSAVETAGDLFGMFNDTPQARSLMRYLVTPEAQQIWVEIGGAISPSSAVPVDAYPDETSQRFAEILNDAEVVRFDASDKMPDQMNQAFWSAVLDAVQDPNNLDGILEELDGIQEEAYAEQGTAASNPAGAPEDDEGLGGEISILAVWADAEQDAFMSMIQPWVDRTGVTVNYEGTRDLNAVLTTRVEGGNPPDVAGLPGPGQMAQFARNGDLYSLENVVDADQMVNEFGYNEGWVTDGTVDDQFVGIFIKVAVKGLIFYNPEQFEAGGYAVPEDFEAFEALVDQIKEDGATPWGIGLEDASASGWPGTDWIEDFVLRQSGPDVYDAWWQGEQAWTSPEIREAFEAFIRWTQ
jgi:Bacterial extracellular solute-binding protein